MLTKRWVKEYEMIVEMLLNAINIIGSFHIIVDEVTERMIFARFFNGLFLRRTTNKATSNNKGKIFIGPEQETLECR